MKPVINYQGLHHFILDMNSATPGVDVNAKLRRLAIWLG